MKGYLLVDKDGWVVGRVMGDVVNPKDYPNEKLIEINKRVLAELSIIQPILFWDGEKLCQVKDEKKIWKRLRNTGLSGLACAQAVKEIKDLHFGLSDIPPNVKIQEPTVGPKTLEPKFQRVIKPGLRLELCNEKDIDLWSNVMEKSGLFNKDDIFPHLVQWLSDPMVWGTKVIWKDRVLQLEMYHFTAKDTTVWTGFQTHVERRWPLWFWRQLAKPIFESLISHGIEYAMGSVRKDRRDWIEYLKAAYGDKELKETGKGVYLKHNIRDALGLIGEWPQRRTVKDWRLEKDGHLVREVTEKDIPGLVSAIDKSWGDSPRKALALQVLDDDWNLCNSAMLITCVDGEIVSCVDIREKDPTTSALHYLIKPKYPSMDVNVPFEGMALWHKEVGYKEMSATIETKLFNRVKDIWEKAGFKLYAQWQDLTAMRQTVDDALKPYI